MFKIGFLFIAIVSLAQAYNYPGENQPASNPETPQQQIRANSFLKPVANERWANGFNNQPADGQDGLYIRTQLRSNPLQRNINFRSTEQQSNLRPNGANLLPGTGLVNDDMATVSGERSNQRLLPSVSNDASRVSRTNSRGVSDLSSAVSVQKNEASAQVQTNSGALPLSQLSRLRTQSQASSPYYRSETLEQMLNRRSADKFLGHGFIQQTLIQQKGDDKFLRVYGKEERELNGTIEVKKGGLVNANLEEVKDGKFTVMDRDNRKVGDVNMHRDVEKHLKMTENNGVTNVELEKNSNAELNVERDVNLNPRIRYGGQSNTPNPSHKVRVHLEQTQNSRANVEIAKNQVQQTSAAPDNNGRDNNGRFRRNVDNPLANFPMNVRY